MLPDAYVLVAINTAAVVAETINEPPDDPRATRDAWIESRRSPLLGVPSWNVLESYNVLITEVGEGGGDAPNLAYVYVLF
jgi:hypothetical protein